jgi:hypothetical protein
MPLFGAGNKREEKKRIVCKKLEQWLRRYSGCKGQPNKNLSTV